MAYRVTFAAALLATVLLAAIANATTIASGNAKRSGDSGHQVWSAVQKGSSQTVLWALDHGVLTSCTRFNDMHLAHYLQNCASSCTML